MVLRPKDLVHRSSRWLLFFGFLQIDIVGHSGDSDEVPFVNSNSPPANDKERLQVLKVCVYVDYLLYT